MKYSRSTVRKQPDIEPAADPYADEAMAMVYVGDVYSLVAQRGAPGEVKVVPAQEQKPERNKPQDDNDALWPLIR